MPTPTDHDTAERAGEQVAHEARVSFPHAGRSPEFVALYTEAREALDAGQWDLVSRMISVAEQATADVEHDELWSLVDGVARHFPGQAPAIRATARHIFDAGDPEACGVLGEEIMEVRPPAREWVECLGPVAPDGKPRPGA